METNNPYSSPQSNLFGGTDATSGDGVTQGVLLQLQKTKPWVRFMSVMMFVGAAFLVLAAVGADARVTVTKVAADGTATAADVTVPGDSVAQVDVTGTAAVWLRPSGGAVRAGLVLELTDAGGPLYSVVALNPAVVTGTDVVVRDVRR